MKTRRVLTCGWLTWLGAAALLIGCQSAYKTSITNDLARRQQFQEQLVLSTEAINAGDLEQAREHVRDAASWAVGPSEEQKVDSLEKLIAGAEALLAGEADEAQRQWAQIEDRELSAEVRGKARLVGMAVSDPVLTIEESEVP